MTTGTLLDMTAHICTMYIVPYEAGMQLLFAVPNWTIRSEFWKHVTKMWGKNHLFISFEIALCLRVTDSKQDTGRAGRNHYTDD